MRTILFSVLTVTTVLSGGLTRPVQAQTGRIAHFSHSGSAAVSDAAAVWEDNFGDICTHQFRVQTIVATSDTTAVLSGKMVFVCMGSPVKDSLSRAQPRTATAFFGGRRGQVIEIPAVASFGCNCTVATRQSVTKGFKSIYPEARLIGFDSSSVPSAPMQMDAPLLKKQKTKRKKGTALLPAFPTIPREPGALLAVVLVVGLGGLGWLLGEQSQSATSARS